MYYCVTRESVFDIVTVLRARRSGCRISAAEDFVLSKSSKLALRPTSLLLTGYRGSFPGGEGGRAAGA
jgi:hypothetical protein